jgi:hypothetical protein
VYRVRTNAIQIFHLVLNSSHAQQEAEDGGEKRRSSNVAAPGRVSGTKHARARRSFSSANLTKSNRPDVGLRRALSQEPLPPAGAGAVAEGASKKHGGAATPKRKALSGSKGVKVHGSARQAGPKPPRGGLPRGWSSGGMEAAVLPSSTGEQDAASDREDETRKASSPRPFVGSDNGDTGMETARAASPESECGSEVVDDGVAADGGGAEVKNAVVDVAEKRGGEAIVVRSSETDAKLRNGEITSDSEIEPSYVLIKKKAVEGEAVGGSDALGAGSDADPHLEDKNVGNAADQATAAADAEIATTANAEESSDQLSSFTATDAGMSDRFSARNSSPSCSSRAQSIERLLEADAALVRKKREDQSAGGVRRSAQAVSTPPSARSRAASGAARPTTSPRGTGLGFKKRFLSFGKKTRGKDGATVIDCTSPASLPASPADCGSTRRRCRTADDSIRPRVVASSSDAAASDDTDHGCAASPHGKFHLVLFSFSVP